MLVVYMKVRHWANTLQVLGICFFALGFISTVGIIGHWHFGQNVPWLFVAYAAMNILLGAGFFARERWLLVAVGLNVVAYAVLYLLLWVRGGEIDLVHVAVSTAVAGGVWGLVYLNRQRLVATRSRMVGAGFFIIWILVYVYTFTSIVI